MTDILDQVRAFFASRHPTAPYASVARLADAWLKEAGDNAALLLTTDALAPTRDTVANVIEHANPELLVEPEEPATVPVSKRPLKDLTVEEQRALVGAKFGIDPGKLLATDFKRLLSEMLAHEQTAPSRAATKPTTKQSKNVSQPKVINGMSVTSADFQRLPPQERIRLARQAQKSG